MVAHAKAPSKDSCSTRGGEVRLSYTQDAAPREVRVEPENHNLPAVESLQCKDSAASESVCGRPAVSALWSSVACTARPLCASGLGQATTRGRLKHRLLTQPSQERCHPGKQVPTFTGRSPVPVLLNMISGTAGGPVRRAGPARGAAVWGWGAVAPEGVWEARARRAEARGGAADVLQYVRGASCVSDDGGPGRGLESVD